MIYSEFPKDIVKKSGDDLTVFSNFKQTAMSRNTELLIPMIKNRASFGTIGCPRDRLNIMIISINESKYSFVSCLEE